MSDEGTPRVPPGEPGAATSDTPAAPAGVAEARRLSQDFEREASAVVDRPAWEGLRRRWSGRKQGVVRELLGRMGQVPGPERKAYGAAVNTLKDRVEARLGQLDAELGEREREGANRQAAVDVTLPGRRPKLGNLHPLPGVLEELYEIFAELGYSIAEGPEIEDDYHNFEALNFPEDHPARDTQDTFFLKNGLLLRTHTSPVQIRTMLARKPPSRVICPGRVYRFDNDLRHSPMFHQLEGLAVAPGITFAHMKGTLEAFLKRLFSPSVEVRLRPSFFPFTEPSAEVDVSCQICGGKGCDTCSGTGWMEIMGCGMVDPRVLENCGIDPDLYSGFAFGLGIDRVAMNRYDFPNIRVFFENDERLLRQVRG